MEASLFTLEQAEDWDRIVKSTDTYTFFHCMAWGKVLSDAYGFVPVYLAVHDGTEFGAVPLMEVRKPFLGWRGVCLPFSDVCGPALTSSRGIEMLEPFLFDLVRKRRWTALEIRDSCGISGLSPYKQVFEHELTLCTELEMIARSFRSSTWRNTKRAERNGVEVQLDTTKSALDTYYRLHCITRKRHGVPPQPKRFFDSLYEHIIDRGNGFIAKATFQGRVVAASVFLHFGTKAVYKFGASLPDHEHLRPGNLIMWQAIKWYASRGFAALSLGRTDRDDAGLMQFKNGWGATCREVCYCRWPPAAGVRANLHAARSHLLSSVARRMPLPVLKLAGTLMYRYLG
jgi:hypothetical protein